MPHTPAIPRDPPATPDPLDALQTMHAQLAGILALAHDAIIAADTGLRITLFNAGAERMFGYRAPVILGQPLTTIVADLGAALAGWQPDQLLRCQGRRADGSSFPAEASLAQIELAGVPAFTMLLRDIGERERAEAQNRAHTARLQVLADASRAFAAAGADYQALLDQVARTTAEQLRATCTIQLLADDGQSLLPVALYDTDAEVVALIREAYRATPLSRDEINRMTGIFDSGKARLLPVVDPAVMAAHMPPERLAIRRRILPESAIVVPLLARDRPIGMLALARHRANQPAFTEDDLTMAQDLAERATLAIGTAQALSHAQRELAERQRAEAALRDSEQKLRTIFDLLPVGVSVLNEQRQIVIANRALERIMGAPRDNLLSGSYGHLAYVRLDGSPMPPAEFASVRALASHGPVSDVEMGVVRENGSQIWVSVSAVPVEAGDWRVVVVSSDITERKRAEQQLLRTTDDLRRSNAELEQFAYVASHDLQEPLRTIAGMVELLQQRYGGQLDERADRYIALAVEGATRMQTLINDLLAFSRLDTRAQQFAAVPAQSALDTATAGLALAIRESGAQVTHGELPIVQADAGWLAQLFQNLISNALKFRGQQPPAIHVSAERQGEGWRFAVSDNGIGIAPEYFERIFVVFQRLHTRRAYPGNGIGLALCKKIVERHGGQIGVTSALGQGSTFWFTIPDRRHADAR